jgi:hypothetical protein
MKNCKVSDCEVCTAIEEKLGSNADWCFEWLRQLKDFEASEEVAEKDQVLQMVDHTDKRADHIRSKLAILQTQTVGHFL